jgi:hypothetical protein
VLRSRPRYSALRAYTITLNTYFTFPPTDVPLFTSEHAFAAQHVGGIRQTRFRTINDTSMCAQETANGDDCTVHSVMYSPVCVDATMQRRTPVRSHACVQYTR